jgi:hypothetical protein
MCIFVLKETVAYYTSNNSFVYCCFLTLPKRSIIFHSKLIRLLIIRGIPAIVIGFIMMLYTNRLANVRWLSELLDSFAVHV